MRLLILHKPFYIHLCTFPLFILFYEKNEGKKNRILFNWCCMYKCNVMQFCNSQNGTIIFKVLSTISHLLFSCKDRTKRISTNTTLTIYSSLILLILLHLLLFLEQFSNCGFFVDAYWVSSYLNGLSCWLQI